MKCPKISVLIEGYNDSLDLGSALETVKSIGEQNYPLDQVEIILTGSETQAARWKEALAEERRFFDVKVLGVEANYHRLKNLAAEMAAGDILAFTDSDVLVDQGWLAAIARGIENGADLVAGVSLFRYGDGSPDRFGLLTAASSVSWGFIAGDAPQSARGFLSHNVGFRRSAFERIRYREDLGRTCAGSFLYEAAVRSGLNIRFQSDQRALHTFTWRWWITRLHTRFGYEIFLLRRLNPSAQHAWTRHLSLVEPLATMAWHVALDLPQWFRYSKHFGWRWPRRVAYLPQVCAVSILARSAEAFGMYSTIVNQERMRRFALSN
jgi:glycosyltransferase involved in cell wall biosynthesis